MTDTTNTTHPYIPQRLAVKSMRDSGYKNTAFAVAELIDNSYQAIQDVQVRQPDHAGVIDIVLVEREEAVHAQKRWRVCEIAVIDNGCGMTSEQLRNALQFGNGTHLDDRSGIGRFGMGLPNSTVSQCRRADVWTWKTGYRNAITSHLDLGQIEDDSVQEVPVPRTESLPTRWVQGGSCVELSDCGTVIAWSDLDRVKWKTAASTLNNIELLVGRVYRKLIGRGLVINLVTMREGAGTSVERRQVRANDPLFLMAPTSTPAPYDQTPMFQLYGTGVQKFPIEFNGDTHEVVVRLSYVKDEVRQTKDNMDAGKTPHGKFARSNEGVSIVRAERELMLDTSWVGGDFRERWWGAEIEFPPVLDEVFGVTNNKQSATNFADMAQYYLDTQNDDEWQQARQEWSEENDPRLQLVDICNYLHGQLQQLRTVISEQRKGARGRAKQDPRHEEAAELAATTAFKDRKSQGFDAGKTDEEVEPEHKGETVEQDLLEKNYPAEQAKQLAQYVTEQNLGVLFIEAHDEERNAFFAPEDRPGITEIVFNSAHPAYTHLISVLNPKTDDENAAQLRLRIDHAAATMRLVLSAWARYELEEKAGDRRNAVRESRGEWGKMTKAFLRDTELPDLGTGED